MIKIAQFIFAVVITLQSPAIAQQHFPFVEPDQLMSMKANLKFLSDDILEGRNAPSSGEKTAALFIATELARYNVMPFGDNGSWYHGFEVKSRTLQGNSEFILTDKKGNILSKLCPGPDYTIDNSKIFAPEYLNKEAGIVFAGYGITAPEYNYNDYRNLNVKGKIVMILAGEPEGESADFFAGKEKTHYSGWPHKFQNAIDRGAVGVFLILPQYYNDIWYVFHSIMMTGVLMLSENEFPEPGGIPYAMLTLEGTQKILSGEKVSYEKMLEMQKGIILAESFALKKYTSFSLMGLENIDTLRNVIGLIQGNDQELQKEYIVLSAHYDHVGLYNGLICNGANDNASGVVAVLELAKRFASEKSNKRSIILAFFTAEEKGLLGSEAFVRDFSDNHKIVANINIDMCGRGDTNQIFAIGADRTSSDLAEIIQICNAQTVHMGIDLSLSNSAYFNLSDHYPFAKKEIPAVFFFDNYKNGLHGPDDEFEHINFEKIMKVVLLTEQITHHLNNMQTCPVFDG